MLCRCGLSAASRILSAMDESVDPCEDFFDYACGTWNRVHIIPDDKSSYNTFRKLGDELHATLKGTSSSMKRRVLKHRIFKWRCWSWCAI